MKQDKTKRIELKISSHLLSSFISADESGLEAEDIEAITWAIEVYGPFFHVYMPDQLETRLERCDITGFISDCYTCEVEVSDEK